MVVGVLTATLEIPFARSLKDKRSVVNSLKGRIASRFNASVAETDYNDIWNRAELGVAIVCNDAKAVDSQLSSVSAFIGSSEGDFRIEDISTEILHV